MRDSVSDDLFVIKGNATTALAPIEREREIGDSACALLEARSQFNAYKPYTDLEALYISSRVEDWDGDKSRGVTSIVFDWAYRFLKALPTHVPPPDIGVDRDGNVYFEWARSHKQNLTILVDERGYLYYSRVSGGTRAKGALPFKGEFPTELRWQLQRYNEHA